MVAADARSRPVRVPFSAADEVIHLLDNAVEPWSIEVELNVSGRLDEARLRTAFAAALQRHPLCRARQVPPRLRDRRFSWEITREPDLDPLRAVECPGDESLAAVRDELQSVSVPLTESPPLRARLARHPEGDVLLLNASHVATDGFGALRVLRSIARAYAGEQDPLPALDVVEARDLGVTLAAPDRATRARRLLTLAEKLRDLAAAPARIASDGGADGPGYGFHHLVLDVRETRALSATDHPGTVNDVLLAALHLAVAAWNDEHGVPCRRISVLMPVNLRPREWWEEVVGNFSLMVRVSTTPAQRASARAALDAVSAQTRRVKTAGTGASLLEAVGRLPGTPVWAKRGLRPFLVATGNRLVDTAILTNLGRLDQLPSFGPGVEARELFFSAPARMPLGISIGAVTVGDRLHLSFRRRHPCMGPDAVSRFATAYRTQLAAVAGC